MFGLEIGAERAGLRPYSGARISDTALMSAACDVIQRYLFPEPTVPAAPVLVTRPKKKDAGRVDRADRRSSPR
jgi:hypothetical protein